VIASQRRWEEKGTSPAEIEKGQGTGSVLKAFCFKKAKVNRAGEGNSTKNGGRRIVTEELVYDNREKTCEQSHIH